MVHLGKYLPSKHQYLSSDPYHPHKNLGGTVACVCSSSAGEFEIGGFLDLTGLAQLVSSMFF